MMFQMGRYRDWYVSHDDGETWNEIGINPTAYTLRFEPGKCLLPLGPKHNKGSEST